MDITAALHQAKEQQVAHDPNDGVAVEAYDDCSSPSCRHWKEAGRGRSTLGWASWMEQQS